MALVSASGFAENTELDTTKVEQMQEVVVQGVRAQKNAPYAIANIKKAELNAFSKTGKELPMLFSQTPGVLAWSENGLGTGTTYMRIRGAGDSRINVTLDDVLVHDAHCEDNTLQLKLAMMTPEEGFPIALGVIRDVEAPTYNEAVYAQLEEVSGMKKYHNFTELLETNDIWEVK